MRRMISEEKQKLLDNQSIDNGVIVDENDREFNGDVNFTGRTLFDGKNVVLGVDSNGRLGQYIEESGVSPTALSGYEEITIGKTYHVILPSGTDFGDVSAEYVTGTISNFTPSSELDTRNAGDTAIGFGTSAGPTTANGLESVSGGTQNVIVRPTTAKVEFDIVVSAVRKGATQTNNLYQYMYPYVQIPVFHKFVIDTEIE